MASVAGDGRIPVISSESRPRPDEVQSPRWPIPGRMAASTAGVARLDGINPRRAARDQGIQGSRPGLYGGGEVPSTRCCPGQVLAAVLSCIGQQLGHAVARAVKSRGGSQEPRIVSSGCRSRLPLPDRSSLLLMPPHIRQPTSNHSAWRPMIIETSPG